MDNIDSLPIDPKTPLSLEEEALLSTYLEPKMAKQQTFSKLITEFKLPVLVFLVTLVIQLPFVDVILSHIPYTRTSSFAKMVSLSLSASALVYILLDDR
jgi:hypothetical protein